MKNHIILLMGIAGTGWSKMNIIRDAIFSCIAEDCPKDDNFIITFEMLADNPYHESFYREVLKLVQARDAVFYPISLICNPEEIAKRVISPDRADYLKTQDADMVQKRATEHEVFYTQHENEISLDVTELSATDAAKTILSQIT